MSSLSFKAHCGLNPEVRASAIQKYNLEVGAC